MIISTTDRIGRRGTPQRLVEIMTQKRGAKFVNYSPGIGEAFITFSNRTDIIPDKNIRNLVFLGSFPMKTNGVQPGMNWDNIDHVVFISKFYEAIVRSSYDIKCKTSVINFIGGCPADSDILSPILKPRKCPDRINFICCAKWWKRKFKRLPQILNLFRNYILKKYPRSLLHVLGNNIKRDICENNVIFYKKSHHDLNYVKIWKAAHINISLSPIDSGPMTLNESLHYRVPFVYPANSAALDYIEHLGKCGEIVTIDPLLKTAEDCRKYMPITNKLHYGKELDYEIILNSITKIINNFEEYTSWEWTDDFNYDTQIDKWMEAFHG